MKRQDQGIAEFFEQQRSRLLHYIRLKAASIPEFDPEDILQDVMLSLIGRDGSVSAIENLAGYVRRAIENRIIDRRRGRKPSVSMESSVNDDGVTLGDMLGDMQYEAHTAMEKKELARRLADAVDSLAPPYRSVWVATEVEGRSFAELSEEWSEPLNTLLSRKHRAAKMLKKKLADIA
ncbi:MAG: RNA polymerase sigma factor [Spirochaetota bacterium]